MGGKSQGIRESRGRADGGSLVYVGVQSRKISGTLVVAIGARALGRNLTGTAGFNISDALEARRETSIPGLLVAFFPSIFCEKKEGLSRVPGGERDRCI